MFIITISLHVYEKKLEKVPDYCAWNAFKNANNGHFKLPNSERYQIICCENVTKELITSHICVHIQSRGRTNTISHKSYNYNCCDNIADISRSDLVRIKTQIMGDLLGLIM